MDNIIELPKELTDNTYRYLSLLAAVVDYTSPESSMQIRVMRDGFNITLLPGDRDHRQDIIDNLLNIHKKLKIKIKFSSSLKISRLIQFKIKNFGK